MRLFRVFLPHDGLSSGEEVVFDGESLHYLARVLRARVGDVVVFINGDGFDYRARILSLARREGRAVILERLANTRAPRYALHLFMALIKSERLDFVVQKAVELGVSELSLVQCARSERRFDKARWQRKAEHLQGVMVAAALQCGRSEWPILHAPLLLDEAALAKEDLRVVLSTNEAGNPWQNKGESVALLVGPEGGFSKEEEALLLQCGWQSASLGERILRADTAAVLGLGLLQFLRGGLS